MLISLIRLRRQSSFIDYIEAGGLLPPGPTGWPLRHMAVRGRRLPEPRCFHGPPLLAITNAANYASRWDGTRAADATSSPLDMGASPLPDTDSDAQYLDTSPHLFRFSLQRVPMICRVSARLAC